ncbi:uncharacterized protein NEMAJ01_1368 [Nematocida major]|uniref:uncharacterized protein n=1 Tax=Nematocida major TaxID=1912982 RepID=UPI002007F611|nr:uncharacterized protein NEMAJ01_1368 [Nematocida major]KAH9386472.1 hypothetical protein NEMAJ01_1368 [Nematocida major]
MWTTTTRLHLLNAIARYGLKKTSFIAAYLKVYAKVASNNWKNEYNKMVKEYFKNRGTAESVKDYFKKKRAHEIELLIEKKREEKSKVIERMIYGYDSLETSNEESDESDEFLCKVEEEISPEIAGLGETSISSVWGIKTPNTLFSTLLHLSTLGNLPPHLELPGPKPETFTPIDMHPHAVEEGDVSPDGHTALSTKEQELEDLFTTLETSAYGVSVSAVDQNAFEKFFQWTQERLAYLDRRNQELEEITKQENEAEEKARERVREFLQTPISDAMKEYYALDFHEYPRKRSPRDKTRWMKDFKLVSERIRSVLNGKIRCDSHKPQPGTHGEPKKEREERGKPLCAKCFDIDLLEQGLSGEFGAKPTMAECVFRSMLFLQTVIFTQHKVVSTKDVELIKTELYRFYEYYRK